MSTLHEISSMKDGEGFISVGPVVVAKQLNPKTAKNGKMYCSCFLKNGASDMMLQLWDGAAGWKLPLDVPVTLRGKFSKGSFNNGPTIRCEELSKPEGAEPFKPEEVQAAVGKPSVRECIDAGIRAADYCVRKNAPDCASAAFAFAAQALLDGHKLTE
jgi:hypothetical protein